MKTVYLFRHGDAEENGSGSDYTRKLTKQGRLMTSEMAEYLKGSLDVPELIITSGAPRAGETAEILAETFNYPVIDISVDDNLYYTSAAVDIMPLLWNVPPDSSSVMAVGHNPLLSELVTYVSCTLNLISMDKSSVVRIDFEAEEWRSIKPRTGNIVFYKTFNGGKIIDVQE